MNRISIAAVALLGMILAACTTTGGSSRSSSQAEDQSRSEFRAFYGPCVRPTTKKATESFSFGEVFGGAIISNTLGRIGTALRKAGEAEAYPETTFRNLEIEPGTVEPCVQIVKGHFGDTVTDDLSSLIFLKEAVVLEGAPEVDAANTTLALVSNNLARAGIYLQSEPVFFFEGQLRPSADKSALVLAPSFYAYREPLKPGRRATTAYALLVSVSFHPPGKAADSKEAAGVSLALGALRPGDATHRVYPQPNEGEMTPYETPWFPSFAKAPIAGSKTPSPKVNLNGSSAAAHPGSGGPEAGNPTSPPPSSEGSGNANGTGVIPLILSASVTETRKANEVLLFFADVFDASKDKLQTELEQAWITSVGDAADLADYTGEQAKLTDYYAKFAAAETALAEVCALSVDTSSTETTRLAAAAKLFGAQSAANVAARIANLPVPYPTMVKVTGERMNCSG